MQVRVTLSGYNKLMREFRRDPIRARNSLKRATKAGALFLRPKLLRNIKRSKKKKAYHLSDKAGIRSGRRTRVDTQSTDIVWKGGKKSGYAFHQETPHKHNISGKPVKETRYIRDATDENTQKVADIVMNEIERALGF